MSIKKTNVFESFASLIVMVAAGALLLSYKVIVIQYVAKWYGVLLPYSFKQIFGCLLILHLILANPNRRKVDRDTWDFLKGYLRTAGFITFAWFLTYVLQLIIK